MVTDRALGRPTQGVKAAPQDAVARAEATEAKEPVGITGDSPIAFGGGM